MEIKTHKVLCPLDFIQTNLIDHLEAMVPSSARPGYPYELFILISIGIEFLGACEDMEAWDKAGCSKQRFLRGLSLFPTEYQEFGQFLYAKLRCGMAHVYAPVPGLGLSEDKHGALHLIEHGDRSNSHYQLDLNVQSLFTDFKGACNCVLSKINNQTYPLNSKIYKPFLSIPV